jgi:capsular exopolysaccharide synthesis family protein
MFHPVRNDAPGPKPAPLVGADARGDDPEVVNTIPLSHFIRVLRRHLWLVLAAAVISVAAAGWLAYANGPMYRAVAVIRLSDPRRALTGGVVDDPARQEGRFSDPLLSQASLLTSRKVAGAVVDSMPALRLATLEFAPSMLGAVAVTPEAKTQAFRLAFDGTGFVVRNPSATMRAAYGTTVDLGDVRFTVLQRPDADEGTLVVIPREAAISRLIGYLRVKRRVATDIFDVSYSAADPHLAHQVVNRTVDIFQTTSAEAAQQQSRQRREFLEGQLKVNDSLLAEAREALAEFRRRAGAYGSREALMREQMGLTGVELQRQQLHAERRTYQQILASLRDSSTSRQAVQTALSTPDLAAGPAVTQLSRQLFEYERTRDSLASRSPSHPDLPRYNELLSSTERRLADAVQSGVQTAIVTLDGRIAAMNDLRTRQQELSATEAEEDRLDGRMENLRRVSDELRTEYQKAGIAEAVTVGQVEIVDRAILPSKPVGLGLVEQLVLGLLAGLTLGAAGAFLTDRLGRSIAQRSQVEELGIPILGVVPRCAGAKSPDAVVEAFRGIRLGLVNAYGAGPIIVAITSPASGDGKSFVSSNLALAFAYGKHRTLLVDADLRRGALHRQLKLPRQPGLTDFLVEEANFPGQVVRPTAHASLDFLASGARRRDAPELMGSPRMTELVTGLRSTYDVIVMDTPPLGAGVDALALGTLAGNVLLVLRLGKTQRDMTAAKLEILRRLPLRLLGAVLNDVRESSEYHAYSYYMDGYELTNEPLFRPLAAGEKEASSRVAGWLTRG